MPWRGTYKGKGFTHKYRKDIRNSACRHYHCRIYRTIAIRRYSNPPKALTFA